METKHTKEYAEKLAEICLPNTKGRTAFGTSMEIVRSKERKSFINGYMKAIEETAAPDLLEALNAICKKLKFTSLSDKDTFRLDYEKAINAIKKATE